MKFRASIVLGWLCLVPAALVWAEPQPVPPTPTTPPAVAPRPVIVQPAPPPVPTITPAPEPPVPTTTPMPTAVPVPTPAEAAPAPANGEKTEGNGDKEKKKAPPITFTIGNVTNEVNPYTQGDAKTEEGKTDVTTEDNVLKVVMTGGVGANVFFGCESVATQEFHLVQEFEIGSTDESIKEVTLAVDAGLVGFVRSKHKASACVQCVGVTIYPRCGGAPLVTLSPDRLCVAGPNSCHCGGPLGAQNKDPLPTATVPSLPLGLYTLQADFVIQATACGLLDAHSTAIFSPEPKELDPWEREHDPYKGEDKAGYGFTTIITATPAGAPAEAKAWKKNLVAERKKTKNKLAAGQPRVVR